MRNIKTSLVVVALAMASFGVHAQETVAPNDRPNDRTKNELNRREYGQRTSQYHSSKHISASKLIGKEVKNEQNEQLGKVDDLIVSDDFTVKYAVLSVGGALGVGSSKVAVPINELQCSGDNIRLSATTDELKNAAKAPGADWMIVSGEEWTKDINGYYGNPPARTPYQRNYQGTQDRRFEREALNSPGEDRESVRGKQGDGARDLLHKESTGDLFENNDLGDTSNSSDRTLRQSINQAIRQDYNTDTAQNVSVRVDNGVVTLSGTVASNAEKQNIETRVKAMSGVSQVNNMLTVRN